MSVTVAKSAGFCFGVNRAVELVEKDAANGGWITEFQNGTITWLNAGDGTFAEQVTLK